MPADSSLYESRSGDRVFHSTKCTSLFYLCNPQCPLCQFVPSYHIRKDNCSIIFRSSFTHLEMFILFFVDAATTYRTYIYMYTIMCVVSLITSTLLYRQVLSKLSLVHFYCQRIVDICRVYYTRIPQVYNELTAVRE